MIVRWLVEAVADLEDILDYAARQNRQLAQNIATRVEHAETTIRTFPKGARYDPELDVFERYVPRTRVILVYRVLPTEVVIVGVFHTSRNPDDKPIR